ncbi:signal transduction histidine kinase [Limimaricola variabilis]|uniref:histidine kinase n=1 Tax=Limimaricola variabilis TaxID=1492771 RepID=A0ABR6HK45_9RHOB|nr:ATP-binding protein [Limimaricola variabilis]MBB3710917.1 signal transduction histidine kinase [Limimaricola variabilis]
MNWRSMRAQTTAIIVASFVLSHLVGYAFYHVDRQGALELTEAVDLAERAAGISRLLRDLPPSWRGEVVQLSDSRAFRVWTSTASPPVQAEMSEEESGVLAYLRTQVPRIADNEMQVRMLERVSDAISPPEFDPTNRLGSPAAAIDLPQDGPGLLVSIRHGPEEWINFLGTFSTPVPLSPGLLMANLISAVIGIALVAFWLVGRVTRPLARFAQAAEALGQDLSSSPLPVSGPQEVSQAARAFNRMQARLRQLIQSRTGMLAAISHDLRTPLTQIRLRVEAMPASEDQTRILGTIDDMNTSIGGFLAYAHASHEGEHRSKVDLGALVSTICDDLADCGAPVDYDCKTGLIVRCKRVAMKRAILNLIENAVKYGHSAQVVVARNGRLAEVIIEDCGPGIPEGDLPRLLLPFKKGGVSGSDREGGGHGLGLAIAQAIVEDHGGELRFANRKNGGLRVHLTMPTTEDV